MKPHSHCIRYHIVRNLEQPEDIPEVSTTVIPVNNALLPWPVFLAPTRKSVVTRTNTRATEVLKSSDPEVGGGVGVGEGPSCPVDTSRARQLVTAAQVSPLKPSSLKITPASWPHTTHPQPGLLPRKPPDEPPQGDEPAKGTAPRLGTAEVGRGERSLRGGHSSEAPTATCDHVAGSWGRRRASGARTRPE